MTASVTAGTRLDELIAAQEQRFLERQPRSRELLERAGRSLAKAVASSMSRSAAPRQRAAIIRRSYRNHS